MALFSMLVKLGLDASSFEAGAKKAESTMTGLGRSIIGSVKGQLAAAFSIGAVSAFTHSVIEAADRIGDLSAQFGLTNEQVQKLEIAAGRVGVQTESIGQMLAKVGEYRRKAGEGDAESLANLQKMGVSLKDIQTSSVSNWDLAEKITRSYESSNRTSKEQADIFDVTGMKAQKLLAVFEEMHRMGPVKMFSDEDIQSISEFKDATDDIVRNMKVAAAPMVGWWAKVMNDRADMERKGFDKWYNLNLIGALGRAFTGDADGAKTPGMSKDEVRAEAARRKAQRAADSEDMYAPKMSSVQPGGNQRSMSGGPLRSIGGILFDRADDTDARRMMIDLQKRTAAATEKTATTLDSATRQ